MTNDTCPTCGQPVQVVSSDEGTQHYVAAEQSALLRALHDRDHTIEHLVQANHALHDELAAARARIAALENQLDELGEGAYRAAAERDNHYVPQLHEWKERAERAEAMCVALRNALNAMGVTFSADETRLAAVVIGGRPIDHYPDMEARIERIAAAHARRLELIAADDPGAQIRLVVDAARRFVQALDATEASIRPDPEGVIDGPHGQALRAAVAALDAAREEATA